MLISPTNSGCAVSGRTARIKACIQRINPVEAYKKEWETKTNAETYTHARWIRALVVTLVLALSLPLSSKADDTPTFLISTVANSLSWPTDVKSDWAGSLYFCDWSARIFKLTAATGQLTVVAGTGVSGYGGDGGPATEAMLGGPGSLALDNSGDIYFADPYNHRIRKISRDRGTITTVVGNGIDFDSGDGGPALDAGIGWVGGIVVDPQGDLYFSNGANRVRKVTVRTGIVTTVAGMWNSRNSGDGGPAVQAEIDQPEGLALDREGNLYIAARGEHRIRKVDAATGIITTVAGSSPGVAGMMGIIVYQGGFSGDGGLATSALLNDPEFIVADFEGNFYISDTQNLRIRRVDANSGVISTIAGTGVAGSAGDNGPAADAQISYPAGIAIDVRGRLYFADAQNGAIRMLAPSRH